jgi:hypothetical protein
MQSRTLRAPVWRSGGIRSSRGLVLALAAGLTLAGCEPGRRWSECALVHEFANSRLAKVREITATNAAPDGGAVAPKAPQYRQVSAELRQLAEDLQELALMDAGVREATAGYAQSLIKGAERAREFATELRVGGKGLTKARQASRDRVLQRARADVRTSQAARERLQRACTLQDSAIPGMP